MSFSDDRLFTEFSQPESERCRDCGSTNCVYDDVYGFWECSDCHACWGHDKDDPDYGELDDPSAVLSSLEADRLRDFLQTCLQELI